MNSPATHGGTALLAIAVSLFVSPMAAADVVTDWNVEATVIVVAGEVPAAPAVRLMAIVQTAAYKAVNAITQRYPAEPVKLDAAPGASVEAAVAGANRAVLSQLVPSQLAAIDSADQAALSPSRPARRNPPGSRPGKGRPPRSSRGAPRMAPRGRKAIDRVRRRAPTCRPSSRRFRSGHSASRG